MKKNIQNAEDAFTKSCQLMHTLANTCHNWLLLTSEQPTKTIFADSGCLRSARLARLRPVTHEVTPQSALQLVVLPADFDGVRFRGYNHPRWQLLVYSWLGAEATRQLICHLQSKELVPPQCTFFLVKAGECEKMNR